MTPEEIEADERALRSELMAAALRGSKRDDDRRSQAAILSGVAGSLAGYSDPTARGLVGQFNHQADRLRPSASGSDLLEAIARRRQATAARPPPGPKGPSPKEVEGSKLLRLEGYELDPEYSLKPEVADKLRTSQADTRQMLENINEMLSLYSKHGNKVLPGPARARMQAIARHMQLAAKGKTMFELGVLAGPDLSLLEATIPNPTNQNATVADFLSGGGDAAETAERYRVMADQVRNRFESAVRSRGYRKAGGQGGTQGGSMELGGSVRLLDPDGNAFDVDAAEAEEALKNGWTRPAK